MIIIQTYYARFKVGDIVRLAPGIVMGNQSNGHMLTKDMLLTSEKEIMTISKVVYYEAHVLYKINNQVYRFWAEDWLTLVDNSESLNDIFMSRLEDNLLTASDLIPARTRDYVRKDAYHWAWKKGNSLFRDDESDRPIELETGRVQFNGVTAPQEGPDY